MKVAQYYLGRGTDLLQRKEMVKGNYIQNAKFI